MKKTFIAGVLALVFVFSCAGGLSVSAVEPDVLADLDLESITAEDVAIIKEASTFAYMSIEGAPAELQEKIKEARLDIIYHQSWSVDGEARVIGADGTVTVLPTFYDLFPDDWDVPTVEINNGATVDGTSITPMAVTKRDIYKGWVSLKQNTGEVKATPFVWFTAELTTFKVATVYLDKLNYVSSANIGFSTSIGKEVAYKMGMTPGDWLEIKTTIGTKYGVRASTDSSYPYGQARVEVWEGDIAIIPAD